MLKPRATSLDGTCGPVSSGDVTRSHYSWSGGDVGFLTVTPATPLSPSPTLTSWVGVRGVSVDELWRVLYSGYEGFHSRLFVSVVEDMETVVATLDLMMYEDGPDEEVQDVMRHHIGANSFVLRHHSTLRFSIPAALFIFPAFVDSGAKLIAKIDQDAARVTEIKDVVKLAQSAVGTLTKEQSEMDKRDTIFVKTVEPRSISRSSSVSSSSGKSSTLAPGLSRRKDGSAASLLTPARMPTAHRNRGGGGFGLYRPDVVRLCWRLSHSVGYDLVPADYWDLGDDGGTCDYGYCGGDAIDDADSWDLGVHGGTCGFEVDHGEPDGGGDMVLRLPVPGQRDYGEARLPYDGATTEETTKADERDLAYTARKGGGGVWGA